MEGRCVHRPPSSPHPSTSTPRFHPPPPCFRHELACWIFDWIALTSHYPNPYLSHASLACAQRSCTMCAVCRCTGVLCCAVLCCAVLCCAVLCCAVLCCAVLYAQIKEKLRAERVYDIFRHITERDCKALGFNPRFSRPENLIMTVRALGCGSPYVTASHTCLRAVTPVLHHARILRRVPPSTAASFVCGMLFLSWCLSDPFPCTHASLFASPLVL